MWGPNGIDGSRIRVTADAYTKASDMRRRPRKCAISEYNSQIDVFDDVERTREVGGAKGKAITEASATGPTSG
jgi:hypothetical protein